MSDLAVEPDRFKGRLSRLLQCETSSASTVKIPRHHYVYTCGERDAAVYFIEHGRIKLLAVSPGGKEALLAIYSPGDVFGETCLGKQLVRLETAQAMEETRLKRISQRRFLELLRRESLFEDFAQYLAARIGDQQERIGSLVTTDSEKRLAQTLLSLAQNLGQPYPCNIRIAQKISHEELSEMVGTTRPRITTFMRKFRELGLIEFSEDRFLLVKEKQLAAYLERTS